MDLQNNKLMLMVIGGLVITFAAVLSVKLPLTNKKPQAQVVQPVFEPEQPFPGKGHAYGRYKKAAIVVDRAKYVEGDDAVLFALKAACRENVSRINTSVEMWNIMKEQWPNDNLSDIGRDVDYFPSGVPQCPLDGSAYRLDPYTHRVAGHTHDNIKTPAILERGMYIDVDIYNKAKHVKMPKPDKPASHNNSVNDNSKNNKQK